MTEAQHDWFRYRPHPWHGLSTGDDPPARIDAFIELTPFDVIKYEIDKRTGYLMVDRPQRTSSTPPTPYGFVPRTWCGSRVAALSPTSTRGDGDPLDVCVLTERPVDRTEILLKAHVIGGISMIDGGEADGLIHLASGEPNAVCDLALGALHVESVPTLTVPKNVVQRC